MNYSETTWVLGLLMSLVIVGVMGVLAVVGARRGGRSGAPARVVAVAFGVYGLIFLFFMLSYRTWATDPAGPLVWGLPAPTVWLLVGIFQLPWILVFVLMGKYEAWTLRPDDMAAFRALARRREDRTADDMGGS